MITLFTAATANGQKAAIALEEAGIDYRRRVLDLAAGEHLDADILALNPVGRIPFLELSGHDAPSVIYGTLPIAIYAAESSRLMLPSDGPERYRVLHWAAFAATDASHAFANQFILEEMLRIGDTTVLDFVHRQASRMLGVMEHRLQQADYLAGADYSIADVLAYPIAATSARRLPESLAACPAVADWAARIARRPAVARGMECACD